MAFLEDALKGNVVVIAVAGAAALALPALLPNLAPPLRSMLKLGAGLFFETEAEMEADFIETLVQNTMQGVLAALGGPGTETDRRRAARAQVEHFEARTRARASRFGWNEQDREARYRRHVAKLKQAVADARRERPKSARPLLDHVSGTISEDW